MLFRSPRVHSDRAVAAPGARQSNMVDPFLHTAARRQERERPCGPRPATDTEASADPCLPTHDPCLPPTEEAAARVTSTSHSQHTCMGSSPKGHPCGGATNRPCKERRDRPSPPVSITPPHTCRKRRSPRPPGQTAPTPGPTQVQPSTHLKNTAPGGVCQRSTVPPAGRKPAAGLSAYTRASKAWPCAGKTEGKGPSSS